MSLIYTAEKSLDTGSGKRNSLYIGGRADAKSLEKLERFNVSHILNVTPEKETSIQAGVPNYFEKKKQFRYKRIPVYDAPTSASQLLEAASSIVQFVTSGLYHGSVLIHCQHGVSRSTTCALFYLMSKANMTLHEALSLIRRRRPQAQPIPAFMEILEQYEKQLIEDSTLKNNNNNNNSSSTKKRPRVVAGPSIGPAAPRPAKPIGPQKPTITGDESKDISTETTTTSRTVGPELPPNAARSKKRKVIGPAMMPPPKPQKEEEPSNGRNSPTTPKAPNIAVIGPALPPKKE